MSVGAEDESAAASSPDTALTMATTLGAATSQGGADE